MQSSKKSKAMYYKSDWPEVGLPTALNKPRSSAGFNTNLGDGRWVKETRISNIVSRWVAKQSGFESNLYRFPVWSLYWEIYDTDSNLLTVRLDAPPLLELVDEAVRQLTDVLPWDTAYVFAKLVKDEPLYDALYQVGFEEVEHRCIYRCHVRDIVFKTALFAQDGIRFTSLAAIAPKQLPAYRQQILDICREAFEGKGHSRHFTDPILLKRQPGIAYILDVMALNFEYVMPDHFLVAVDTGSDQVCGFSVVGKKTGLGEDVYTQLLSVVSQTYRGRGIYRGLTSLMPRILPQDATLLNVTHAGNRATHRAYQNSGRVHLVDTVVLRRFYDGASGSISGGVDA
jgi:hypothetical protein